MGESLSGPLGADHSAGPWWKTGAVGEGGSAHPDNTLRGVLLHFRRHDNWSIQSKHWQIIFQTQVGNR